MCYPSIQSLISEELEVCADHVPLSICSLFVRDDAVEVAFVIVTELLIVPDERSVRGIISENNAYPGSWKYLFFVLSSSGGLRCLLRCPSVCLGFAVTGEANEDANNDKEVIAVAYFLNLISDC